MVASLLLGGPAGAAKKTGAEVPGWVKPAVRHLDSLGLIDKAQFRPNRPMERADFKALMKKAFGGGFSRTKGRVTAGEVGAALVRALGQQDVAAALNAARSPDGWDPRVHKRFGTEVVAREMGLRHDRPTSEEAMEARAGDRMKQADVVYGVWRALTAPSLYGADALKAFDLDDYDKTRRQVVRFALSLVGSPYVWGGEWISETPAGYPYGAQPAGGFDCSGFIWYVLQRASENYSPKGRGYDGWSLPERTSRDMAAATPKKKRLSLGQLEAGDLIFFATGGKDAKPADVYHVGLYLGKGWMIHSSGGRAGVSLSPVGKSSWWYDQIVFGRRVIKTG